MRGTHVVQRRLLRRVEVDGIPVRWNVQRSSKAFLRSGSTVWEEGLVINASVGGACIVARRDLDLTTGTQIVIAREDTQGLVAIRWVKSADDARLTHYGVSFVEVDDDLVAYLLDPANASSLMSA